ncbi:MAG: HEAT repeat domain-containing protein [Chloroflexi bacterium]|nr:HEAT repeat domain-containing protein [Chloroflexota bacterium]
MIDQYVRQLDSADPQKRRQAVIALGKSGDRAALPHLARVYKNDPDSEIRDLALRAGRYLKKEVDGQAEAEPVRIERADQETGASYLAPEVDVSAMDIERSRGYVEQAMDAHVRGQDDRAKTLLVKAFTLNPNLRRDHYTSGIAATVTGLPADEAIAALLSAPKETRKRKPKEGGAGSAGGEKEIGWGDATLDLLLFGLVWAGGMVALVLFALQGLQVLVNSAALTGSTVDPDVQAFVATLPQLRVQLVLASIAFGLFTAILFAIQMAVMHFAAVSMLGGDGSLAMLIHRMTPATIGVQIFSIVVVIVYFIAVGTMAASAGARQADSFASVVSLVLFVINIGVTLWLSTIIGKVYDFGMWKGCATQIVGSILLGVIFACMSCTLPSLFAGMLSSGG